MMLAGKTNRYESDTSELGLALAYDIVKAHGGEIRVETKGAREVSLLFSCQFNGIFHTYRKGDVCVFSQSDENGRAQGNLPKFPARASAQRDVNYF